MMFWRLSGFAVVLLAGCASTASAPNLVTTGNPEPVVVGDAQMAIVETLPDEAVSLGVLSGVSCKRLLWDQPPTEGAARSALVGEAKKIGADGLTNVTYSTEPTSLVSNCWSTVTATGIAFKLTSP